jgi:hypothetical protein
MERAQQHWKRIKNDRSHFAAVVASDHGPYDNGVGVACIGNLQVSTKECTVSQVLFPMSQAGSLVARELVAVRLAMQIGYGKIWRREAGLDRDHRIKQKVETFIVVSTNMEAVSRIRMYDEPSAPKLQGLHYHEAAVLRGIVDLSILLARKDVAVSLYWAPEDSTEALSLAEINTKFMKVINFLGGPHGFLQE